MRHKLPASLAFSLTFGSIALLTGATGCAPKLGDGCQRTAECSVNGDRTCDRSQPGGYCTIPDCSSGSCPDDGVCVRFQPDEPRLSRSWCMAECGSTRDCNRDRYVCRTAKQLNEATRQALADAGVLADGGESDAPEIAEVLDHNANRKFCVVKQD